MAGFLDTPYGKAGPGDPARTGGLPELRNEPFTQRAVSEHVAGGGRVIPDRQSAGQRTDLPDADARTFGTGAG